MSHPINPFPNPSLQRFQSKLQGFSAAQGKGVTNIEDGSPDVFSEKTRRGMEADQAFKKGRRTVVDPIVLTNEIITQHQRADSTNQGSISDSLPDTPASAGGGGFQVGGANGPLTKERTTRGIWLFDEPVISFKYLSLLLTSGPNFAPLAVAINANAKVQFITNEGIALEDITWNNQAFLVLETLPEFDTIYTETVAVDATLSRTYSYTEFLPIKSDGYFLPSKKIMTGLFFKLEDEDQVAGAGGPAVWNIGGGGFSETMGY